MNVNTLIQQLQALVEQDAANGELMVLACNGRSEYVLCEPRLEHVMQDEDGTYDTVLIPKTPNSVVIE